MSTQPRTRWDLLVASAVERHGQLSSLLDDLHHQTYGRSMNIIVLGDDCQLPLDDKRNWLVALSNAEYVSFIDDDDQVAPDYVETIYPLLDGVDYVGFQLQHYNQGNPSKPTFHSLEYDKWWEDDKGYYRDISHLNPIKRNIAIQFMFIGDYGEDADWAKQISQSGLVKTQHYVDKVMYHYFSDPDKSLTIGKS